MGTGHAKERTRAESRLDRPRRRLVRLRGLKRFVGNVLHEQVATRQRRRRPPRRVALWRRLLPNDEGWRRRWRRRRVHHQKAIVVGIEPRCRRRGLALLVRLHAPAAKPARAPQLLAGSGAAVATVYQS